MKGSLSLLATVLILFISRGLFIVGPQLKMDNERRRHVESIKCMQRKVHMIKQDCGAVCAVSDPTSYKGKLAL